MRNLHPDGQAMLLFSPSPSVYLQNADEYSLSPISLHKSLFDLATVCIISALLLLSLLALSSIIYLRIRSRQLHHLQNFNSLWIVRLLLVAFASVWAVSEILRLPFTRRHSLYPSLTLKQQANICKIHIVLSLGFFQPSFLITLLFLVKVAIKKKRPSQKRALLLSLMACSTMILLQIYSVYFLPWKGELPKLMHESSVVENHRFGGKRALCTYPFFSSVIFGAFTIGYAMAFLVSCWRVSSLVINKGMRHRIIMLATAVMVALSVQLACLCLSWQWMPEEAEYGLVVLVMFLFVSVSMAVGEVVLVLKPIKDALAAAVTGECSPPEL